MKYMNPRNENHIEFSAGYMKINLIDITNK